MSILRELDDRLQAELRSAGVPGGAIAVYSAGELHVAAHGVSSAAGSEPVSPQTSFPIGCVMKALLSMLAVGLHEERVIDLDAPIGKSDRELHRSQPALRYITLRQLLSHTSGLDDNPLVDTGEGPDRVAEYLASYSDELEMEPTLAAPGEHFSYSAAGYVLAAALIERASGQAWDTLLQTRLCAPSEARIFFGRPPSQAAVEHFRSPHTQSIQAANIFYPACLDPAGSGRCWSSVVDLARIFAACVSTAAGTSFIHPGIASDMYRPHSLVGHNPWGETVAYGLGHFLDRGGGTSVMGFGHGSRAEVTIVAEQGLVIVAAANAAVGGGLFPQLREQIVDGLCGKPLLPRAIEGRRGKEALRTLAPQACIGTYERHGSRIEIIEDEGRLVARHSDKLRRGGSASAIDIPLAHLEGPNFNAERNPRHVRTLSFLQSGDPSAGHIRVNGQLLRRTRLASAVAPC